MILPVSHDLSSCVANVICLFGDSSVIVTENCTCIAIGADRAG